MSHFKIGSLNASSFSKMERRIEVSRYLFQNKFDFLCVQETRLKAGQNCLDHHYSFYRNDEGVGTLIAARKKYKCAQLQINNLTKIQTACISIRGKDGVIILISIYVPCQITRLDLNNDLDAINTFINGRPCILGGVFNTSARQAKYFYDWAATVNHEFRVISPQFLHLDQEVF